MAIDSLMPQRASSAYTDSLSRSAAQAESTPAASSVAAPQSTADTTRTDQPSAVIHLSPDAIVLARALSAAQTMPGVRPDRIAAAQARLAGGDKQIDPYRLAGALLAGNGE
jgi:hypothetical protein